MRSASKDSICPREPTPQHPFPVETEFPCVLSFDDHLLGQQTTLDGILDDGGFAVRCARTRGFLGIRAIGNDLHSTGRRFSLTNRRAYRYWFPIEGGGRNDGTRPACGKRP